MRNGWDSHELSLDNGWMLGSHFGRECGLVIIHESGVRDNNEGAVDLQRVSDSPSAWITGQPAFTIRADLK